MFCNDSCCLESSFKTILEFILTAMREAKRYIDMEKGTRDRPDGRKPACRFFRFLQKKKTGDFGFS